MSVLVIDDEPEYYDLVKSVSIKPVDGVRNLAGALKAIAKNTYDVILVDFVLEGITGDSIVTEIKASSDAKIYLWSNISDLKLLSKYCRVGAVRKDDIDRLTEVCNG